MANSYFSLTDSTNVTKKFRVVQSMYETPLEKSESIQKTLSGGLDVSSGGIYPVYIFGIKVRETETESGYGDLGDLRYFFELNNPNGTPSNVITLTDHFGNTHNVFMSDGFSPQYLGTMVEGANAYSIVKCTFRVIP